MAQTLTTVLFLAMLGYGVLAVDIDCTTMTPAGSSPSTEVAPFTITVTPTTFTPGAKLTVKLTGTVDFHNFLLQARVPGAATPRGTFVNPPQKAILKKCTTGDDSVTHKDENEAKKTLTFQWLAPEAVEKVKFLATVLVKGKATHHKVESNVITKDSSSEEEVPAQVPDEEGEKAAAEARMAEERRKTEEAKKKDEIDRERDSTQPKGAPEDPTEKPTTTKPTPKPYVDGEENDTDKGEQTDEDEDSIDPDETADAITKYQMEDERKKGMEKERHDKAIMDEREDYLRRLEEETPFEEEEKQPEVVIDKNKDKEEEKEKEKDGKTSASACVSVSTALVLIAASLSLF